MKLKQAKSEWKRLYNRYQMEVKQGETDPEQAADILFGAARMAETMFPGNFRDEMTKVVDPIA